MTNKNEQSFIQLIHRNLFLIAKEELNQYEF